MKRYKTTNGPSIIFRIKELEDSEKITLFNIADLLKKKVTITIGLLAYVCGCSDRTINRRLKSLQEKGYITRETKYIEGKKRTNISILWNKIEGYAIKSDYIEGDEETETIPIQENKQHNNIQDMGNFVGELKKKDNTEDIVPFIQILEKYKFLIDAIVEDLNSTLNIRHKQADIRLKELTNRLDTKPHYNSILKYIQSHTIGC